MQSAAERRIAILEYLCECRHTTRERLMTEFGVSNRTIERDLLLLSCSYPIYTVQGVGGGVFIEEGFKLGMKYLTETQSQLLERLTGGLKGADKQIMESILKTFKKQG